jgi:hypothetical protein
MRTILLLILSLSLATAYGQQLQFSIATIPTPVLIDGKSWVYYEMKIMNNADELIKINSLKIMSDRSTLLNLSGETLQKRFSGKDNTILARGSAYIYLEVKTNASHLLHELKYMDSGIVKAIVPLDHKKPVRIDAPLKGNNWAAIYDPSWERGHRRVYFTIGGRARIPGRYAIDFMKLDNAGHFAIHESDTVKNWYGYGKDVLAVADGVIASTLNTFEESKTLSEHPKYDSSRATGNYISLQIADSVFAFYEHLKPGSIRVKPGDHVKAGQVIASLGFTGQTTGPHLHFHIADRNSALGAEGIPFVFKHFNYLGVYRNFIDFGVKPWEPAHKIIINERPNSNAVIEFLP